MDDVSDLPTMIHMDPEELVRSKSSKRRSKPPPSLLAAQPIRARTNQYTLLSIPAWLVRAFPPPPSLNILLSRYTRLPQLKIANTIQTIPQETGFWSILGPFLIDMTIEIAYLFWFFFSEVLYPRLWVILVFLASPVLVGISIPVVTLRNLSNPPPRISPRKPSQRSRRTTRRLI